MDYTLHVSALNDGSGCAYIWSHSGGCMAIYDSLAIATAVLALIGAGTP